MEHGIWLFDCLFVSLNQRILRELTGDSFQLCSGLSELPVGSDWREGSCFQHNWNVNTTFSSLPGKLWTSLRQLRPHAPVTLSNKK